MSLPPELQRYVVEGGPLGPMLKHPLLYTLLLPDEVPESHRVDYAGIIKLKTEQLNRAVERKAWSDFIFTHERAYRTDALMSLWRDHGLGVEQVGALASDVWVDSENIDQYLAEWEEVFTEVPGECWMTPEEREALKRMASEVHLYRGVCDDGHYSWTLDKGVATFFANRGTHNSTGEVIECDIQVREAYAFLDRRSEDEVLILP